jgi:hypothetical protein
MISNFCPSSCTSHNSMHTVAVCTIVAPVSDTFDVPPAQTHPKGHERQTEAPCSTRVSGAGWIPCSRTTWSAVVGQGDPQVRPVSFDDFEDAVVPMGEGEVTYLRIPTRVHPPFTMYSRRDEHAIGETLLAAPKGCTWTTHG